MTLKQRLEKSPLISVLVICCTVGSAVFGVMQYLHSQHITRIEERTFSPN